MVRLRRSLIFSALFGIALASPGYCGDEDAREAKKKTEEKLPQDTAMPKEQIGRAHV